MEVKLLVLVCLVVVLVVVILYPPRLTDPDGFECQTACFYRSLDEEKHDHMVQLQRLKQEGAIKSYTAFEAKARQGECGCSR